MGGRAWVLVVGVVLVAWVVGVGIWSVRPLVDQVPTGIVDAQPTAQAVECGSPLSGDAGPSAPLPSLPPGLAFQREACASMHADARRLLAFDTLALLIGAVIVVSVVRRSSANATDPA